MPVLVGSPDQHRRHQPDGQGRDQAQRSIRERKQSPHRDGKAGKPEAAHGGTSSIQCRGLPPAHRIADSSTLLLFPLVFFDQRRAGGENRGKRQKEAAENRPVLLREQSGDDGDGAAEQKAHGIFIPPRAFQGRKIEGDRHPFYLKTNSQPPRAHASHSASPATETRMDRSRCFAITRAQTAA
jgi:hypothetical protein